MSIQMILNAKAEYGVPVKIYTKDVDEESLTQLRKMAQLQFIHSHIAVMPDVHLGKGATVGSVYSNQECHHSCCGWRGYRLRYECIKT